MSQQVCLAPVRESSPITEVRSDSGADEVARVILGPSLTLWSQTLQQRLGERYLVEDMLSDPAGDGDAGAVVVLGTPEIAPGEIQLYRRRPGAVVLVGIAPCHRGAGATHSIGPLVDRLVDALSGIGDP